MFEKCDSLDFVGWLFQTILSIGVLSVGAISILGAVTLFGWIVG